MHSQYYTQTIESALRQKTDSLCMYLQKGVLPGLNLVSINNLSKHAASKNSPIGMQG